MNFRGWDTRGPRPNSWHWPPNFPGGDSGSQDRWYAVRYSRRMSIECKSGAFRLNPFCRQKRWTTYAWKRENSITVFRWVYCRRFGVSFYIYIYIYILTNDPYEWRSACVCNIQIYWLQVSYDKCFPVLRHLYICWLLSSTNYVCTQSKQLA